jgi:hypothetical protein
MFGRKKVSDADITDVGEVAQDAGQGGGQRAAAVDIDHGRASRFGWLVLAIGFGGFMLWAALAPLDQGVPAGGQVVVTGNRKTVQNLGAGQWSKRSWSRTGMKCRAATILAASRPDDGAVRSTRWRAVSGLSPRRPRRGCWPKRRAGRRSFLPTSCCRHATTRGRRVRWPCRRSCCVPARRRCRPSWGRCAACSPACSLRQRLSRRRGGPRRSKAGCCSMSSRACATWRPKAISRATACPSRSACRRSSAAPFPRTSAISGGHSRALPRSGCG